VTAEPIDEAAEVECRRRWYALDPRCTCPPCLTESRRIAKLRRSGRSLPPSRSDEAWAALERMLQRMSVGAIAKTAGMSPGSLSGSIARNRVRPVTFGRVRAERLIAAEHATVPSGRVNALVTIRQLRALAAIGYTLAALESETGILETTLSTIRAGHLTQTDAAKARVIEAAYARLSMQVGPSVAARRFAERRQWGSPLAWEGVDMADPKAKPRGVVAVVPPSKYPPKSPRKR
jgi:hypothetical protein